MFLQRIACTVALAFALAAPSAQAFFDPPTITPAVPRAGEVVFVNLREGVCDAVVEHPGFPQLTREGNSVRFREYGHHYEPSELCVYDIGHSIQPIGSFPPGNYTLTVEFTYDDYPFGSQTLTVGVVPFAVVGFTPSVSVPILSPASGLALLLLISCAAIATLRRRRRTRQ